MIHKRFEELKCTGQLPSPSKVGMQILMLTQREDWSLDELVHTVEADPALTGRIPRVANSSRMAGSRGATSVNDAAMRLGVTSLRSVALGFSLVSGNRTGTCDGFDYDAFWSGSLVGAVAANSVGSVTELSNAAEAFTCALLGRVGELALASIDPAQYTEILARVESDPSADLVALEEEHFCINHHEVGAALVSDWGLPERFALAIGNYRRRSLKVDSVGDEVAQGLIHTLRIGGAIADYCLADEDGQQRMWPMMKKLRGKLNLGTQGFISLCDEVMERARSWGDLLDIEVAEVEPMSVVEERVSRPKQVLEATNTDLDSLVAEDRMRILAVDDDPLSLKLLAGHLERTGHEVITATNGKEALAVALERNPQVIVTDWMMPEMDGVQLCAALRQYPAGRNLYIIILTGREDEDRVVEAFDAGADDYVTKPFKPRLLLARVRAGQRVVRLQRQVEEDKKAQRQSVARLGAMTRKLEAAAMTDPLTQLPNRRYAMKRLGEEWSRSVRHSRPMSVVMVDIDFFKRVNDTWGHDVGDLVLCEAAKILDDVIRGGDACARMGGEEFLVICTDTDLEGAAMCGERFRSAMEEKTFEAEGEEFQVTVSVGVAQRMSGMSGAESLLKVADEAVYDAKETGRNRVCLGEWRPLQRRSA